MSASRVIIPLPSDFSDGTTAKYPATPYMQLDEDMVYHEKMADMWMDYTGQAEEGTYTHQA
jgi:hypothetical protein